MNISSAIFLIFLAAVSACQNKKTSSKLICYYGKLTDVDSCKCTHVVLPANSDLKAIERVREHLKGVKVLITVNEFNQGLVNTLKSNKVDGIELNLKKLDSKNDINDFISTVRSKLGPELSIVLAVPSKAEILAKYYDFKGLSKSADLFILQTAFLGASKNVTFHPSRLSGLWDMQNTDSVVDLVSGLGAPLSKLVIASPVQAFRFKLQDEKFTAPGSPALEVQSITRDELCKIMKDGGNWTLERDQDQAGPYIFSKDQWIAFDDPTSIDIKAKYARVRGLAGLALKDVSQDGGLKCESSILDAAYTGLSRQARAPRGAVLHSLEREILETPARPLDTVQVSPYRISRVIDVEGNVHVVRQDTRTEFECSRQGYFVHPRSCGRFYRCVKFNQLSDEFNVFEFDCPAGLAFDSRVEVCVWPGSLPHASPCSGSSEIAPVPRQRFVCPQEPGYYADPENCRWFFACLDHGKSPLSAYEFRCPFGLVYDESRLLCEWPWLVPKCGSGYAVGSQIVYRGSGSVTLDQYDGLGVLGVTALGGLHGPLQQPVSKVYSNVGTVGIVSQGQGIGAGNAFGQQTVLELHGTGGYSAGTALLNGVNTGQGTFYGDNGFKGVQYVAGNGGLSIKAAQSLQNAGLLTSGYNGANLQDSAGSGFAYTTGSAGNDGSFGLKVGQSGGSGLVYTQAQDSLLNTVQQGNGFGVTSQQSFVDGANANGVYVNSGLGYTSNSEDQRGNAASSLRTNYVNHDINLNNYQSGSSGQSGEFGSSFHPVGGGFGTGLSAVVGSQSQELLSKLRGQTADSTDQTHQGVVVGSKSQEFGANGFFVQGPSQGSGANGHLVGVGGTVASSGSQTRVFVDGQSQSGANNYLASGGTRSGTTFVDIGQDVRNEGFGANLQLVSTGAGQVNGGSVTSTSDAHLVNGLTYQSGAEFGAKSHQSFSQYHDQSGSVVTGGSLSQGAEGYDSAKATVDSGYESGTSGSINIIGGGYSAVGVVNSGVEVSNYGDDGNAINNVTPSPISVTTVSSIPTVTSVPVPALKVATGFQSYKGGVVANVPELQYKVQRPVKVFYQSNHGSNGIVNITNNLVNYVSSTPTPVTVATGYHYPRPTVSFVEEPIKATVYQQPLIVSTTQAPLVQPVLTNSFVQHHVSSVQPVVTTYQKPLFVTTTQTPLVVEQVNVQPVVSTYNIQKEASFTGYDYPKPSVRFEETGAKTTGGSFSYQNLNTVHKNEGSQGAVIQQVNVQPVVSTYNIQKEASFTGYDYSKPSVRFEETGAKTTGGSFSYQNLNTVHKNEGSQGAVVQQVNVQPVVSTYNIQKEASFTGYDYPKPSVRFEETGAKTTGGSFSYQNLNTVHKSEGSQGAASFSYSAPSTVRPVTVVKEVQPVIQSTVRPAISYSSFQKHQTFENYDQRPQVQVSTYNVPSSSVTPIVEQSPQFYVSSTPASIVEQKVVQPAVVSSFSISSNNGGYQYQKPSVVTYEQPAVQSTVVASQPVVSTYYQRPIQPAVSTYGYKNVVQSVLNQGYSNSKPTIAFQETPASVTRLDYARKPAVVSSYSYTAPSTVRPALVVEQHPVVTYTTPRPQVLIQKQPAVVSSYSFNAASTVRPAVVSEKTVEFTGYDYPKPSVSFVEGSYENRQPVREEPFVAKQAYVTGSQAGSYQYNQQFNSAAAVQVEQKPLAIENYQAPVVSTTPLYEYQQPVEVSSYSFNAASTERPAVAREKTVEFAGYDYPKPSVSFVENRQPIKEEPFVAKQAYVTGSQAASYQYNQQFNSAAAVQVDQKPLVVENYQAPVVSTTPLYEYQQPVVSVSTTPGYQYQQQYSSVDSGYVYDKPAIRFEERPAVVENYQAPIVSSTPRPIVDYNYVQSTPKPTFASTISSVVSTKQPFRYYDSRLVSTPRPVSYSTTALPVVQSVTSSRPIAKYSFSSFDQQYQTGGIVVPTAKVVEEYVAPVQVTTPSPEYLAVQVSTSAPTESYVVPEVTPVGNYGLRVTTSSPLELTREYLPARGRVRVTTTPLPVPEREYLPVRTRITPVRPTTIVKVNDFHPLLSAKLGAQCTCASNSLKLRKYKPLQIVVDDDDDDDGYVVDNNDNGIVVENYQYEPQKTVEITPTPEVYIKSTTSEIIEPSPTPAYVVRKRVRVRPVTPTVLYHAPVTQASEIFVKQAVTPVNTISNRAGLNLVEQTAKVGLESGKFDRYGPGGLRSRNERLQGTIDCQRAGLFRHPTQCNKFYACRWDCTKNRYTLHVFNCPVHLTFDNNLGACNWPSQGPACLENTLLPSD